MTDIATINGVVDPTHYTGRIGWPRPWDLSFFLGFHLGNAIKYLYRAGLKADRPYEKDIGKALNYMNDYLEKLLSTSYSVYYNPVDKIHENKEDNMSVLVLNPLSNEQAHKRIIKNVVRLCFSTKNRIFVEFCDLLFSDLFSPALTETSRNSEIRCGFLRFKTIRQMIALIQTHLDDYMDIKEEAKTKDLEKRTISMLKDAIEQMKDQTGVHNAY